MRNNIQGVALVAGTKQNFAGIKPARANVGQDGLDPLRRQMPQEVAFGKQSKKLFAILLLAANCIFVKSRRKPDRGTLVFEKKRRRVIDDGPQCEAGADGGPGRLHPECLMMKLLRALVAKLDGKCADQGSRSEGKDGGKRPLWKANVKTDSGA